MSEQHDPLRPNGTGGPNPGGPHRAPDPHDLGAQRRAQQKWVSLGTTPARQHAWDHLSDALRQVRDGAVVGALCVSLAGVALVGLDAYKTHLNVQASHAFWSKKIQEHMRAAIGDRAVHYATTHALDGLPAGERAEARLNGGLPKQPVVVEDEYLRQVLAYLEHSPRFAQDMARYKEMGLRTFVLDWNKAGVRPDAMYDGRIPFGETIPVLRGKGPSMSAVVIAINKDAIIKYYADYARQHPEIPPEKLMQAASQEAAMVMAHEFGHAFTSARFWSPPYRGGADIPGFRGLSEVGRDLAGANETWGVGNAHAMRADPTPAEEHGPTHGELAPVVRYENIIRNELGLPHTPHYGVLSGAEYFHEDPTLHARVAAERKTTWQNIRAAVLAERAAMTPLQKAARPPSLLQ